MSASQNDEKRDSTSADATALPAFTRLAEGELHQRLAAVPGNAVVLFTSPNCGACRVWKRLLPTALSGLADVWFEVDASEATGVARYFGIFHLPTIYLYRNGQFHAELQCEARPDAIRQTAGALLSAPAHDEP
jgi:thioredoxin-like negative regulator of GroEL